MTALPTVDEETDDSGSVHCEDKGYGPVGRKWYMADVTVYLKDVNESPAFTAPSKDQDTLYIDENAEGQLV